MKFLSSNRKINKIETNLNGIDIMSHSTAFQRNTDLRGFYERKSFKNSYSRRKREQDEVPLKSVKTPKRLK